MKFNYLDFESMRDWVAKIPTQYWQIRRLRLHMFDKYRYQEDYEHIYTMIKLLGGEILYD